VIVAASDYVKALPDLVGRWLPGRFTSLGAVARGGEIPLTVPQEALRAFAIDPARPNPATM
jgi:pyruvate dehydrogenase complex dehydrogenase (E1) component